MLNRGKKSLETPGFQALEHGDNLERVCSIFENERSNSFEVGKTNPPVLETRKSRHTETPGSLNLIIGDNLVL